MAIDLKIGRITLGDIYAIPLNDGTYGYARCWGHVTYHLRSPLIGIFSLRTAEELLPEEVVKRDHEFTVIRA